MARCPSCQTENVYNSGFTIECVNPACRFFSPEHRNACLGNAPVCGLKIVEEARRIAASPPEMIESVRVSSSTTPIEVEMCYTTDDGQTFSLARWASDTLLECRVSGNWFSAELSVADKASEHQIQVELIGASGEKLYTTSVSFRPEDKKFEVSSMR